MSSYTPLVTYAKLRVADPVADAAAYPSKNVFWRLVAAPFETAVKIACTVKLLWNAGDATQVEKPQPFQLFDRVTGHLGIYPECLFANYYPTYLLGRYLIFEEPKVNNAILEGHRGSFLNEGLFTKGFSAGGLLDTIRDIFKDPEIGDNDMMLTCSEKFTQDYRNWLHQLLGSKSVKQCCETIKDEASNSIEGWVFQCARGEPIDLRKMGQFPSRVLTRLLFNSREGSDDISDALNKINAFIIQSKLTFRVKEEARIEYENACTIFRETIERMIQKDPLLYSTYKDYPLTEQQKKAMAAVLFFAGQETTGFFLANVLLYLAQNPDEQDNLRTVLRRDLKAGKKLLGIVINYILNKYPPAFLVGRRGKADVTLCLDYQFWNDAQEGPKRKLIIQPGTGLSAGIKRVAEKVSREAPDQLSRIGGYQAWTPFGSGTHACPGRSLALTEVKEFVMMALLRCQIKTGEREEPQVVGRVTLQFARPYYITLEPVS